MNTPPGAPKLDSEVIASNRSEKVWLVCVVDWLIGLMGGRERRVRVVRLNGCVEFKSAWNVEEPVRPVAPTNVTGVGVDMTY